MHGLANEIPLGESTLVNRKAVVWLAITFLVIAILCLVVSKPPSSGPLRNGDSNQMSSAPSSESLDVGNHHRGKTAAKSDVRLKLEDILPTGTRIEAEEVGGTTAKGNVWVVFPDGAQLRADHLTASSEDAIFAEGWVAVWTATRKSCFTKREGPLKFFFVAGALRFENEQEGLTLISFPEPQTEEKIRELSARTSFLFHRQVNDAAIEPDTK